VRGIVLFAHGARDPEWARPFERIRDRIRASRPECPIELAYLDFMRPTLEEAVATLAEAGASSITVFPLFMAQGGHLKDDLPRMVEALRQSRPHIPFCMETAIGEVPEVLEAISAWILERVD
jgi:sirohydrochlorin cobaltochelatase